MEKSIPKLIFAGYTGSKNQVQKRLKIHFVELDFSKLIFQKSSTDQQGVWWLHKPQQKLRKRANRSRIWLVNKQSFASVVFWQNRDWQLIYQSNGVFQHLLIIWKNWKLMKYHELSFYSEIIVNWCSHYKRLNISPPNNIFPINEPALVQEQKHHQRATCSMICELFQSCLPKILHSKTNSTLFCH